MTDKILKATHIGELKIGEKVLPCAVLEDGTRVLNQAGFLRAIGRARSPKAGTGVLSTVDDLPFFLQADVLKPFITEELKQSTKPLFYEAKRSKAVGYNARLLPGVGEVYLRFRDECLKSTGKVPERYAHIIQACDIVMRGLAHVGIVALVDEATGYQEIRDKKALQEILDKYLLKEFAAWAKRFPDEFYKQMFRLRGWQWRGMRVNRPSVVGKYTNDLVYQRLAPGVLEELQKRNPKDEKGNREGKHHQLLTPDLGIPALQNHLFATTKFMEASATWDQFYRSMQRAFPKLNSNMVLNFPEGESEPLPWRER
jgi:P63C domain